MRSNTAQSGKLLDRDEQMALLVMRVCGDVHGNYYYPHIAGVGHSKNLYLNKQNASAENKGMLRLVSGMGTRAVDREADDYARLLNMDNPTAPPWSHTVLSISILSTKWMQSA